MSVDIHDQRILIVDFGSQYTQLIARRVRESGVYCEIHPFDVAASFIREFSPRGVVLSGGPESVTQSRTPRIPDVVFELGVPILGICYGMQAMAAQLGGNVESSDVHEFGHADVTVVGTSELLSTVHVDEDGTMPVWMSHGDKVVELPAGFSVAAATPSAPIAAMEWPEKKYYGVQFHPEVTHTQQGLAILRHFTRELCGCEGLWTAANIEMMLLRRFDGLWVTDGLCSASPAVWTPVWSRHCCHGLLAIGLLVCSSTMAFFGKTNAKKSNLHLPQRTCYRSTW